MKKFTSCFLGIPLPQEFQQEFKQLLADIHSNNPHIEVVRPQTPHVTVYYLNKQSQFSLNEIKELVQLKMSIVKNIKIQISGFGCFFEENPKVLFLDVVYPMALTDFNKEISKLLRKYNASDNKLTSHPHMTIGRIKNKQAKESFKINEKNLKSRLNIINWDFQVKEIILYGVDSTESPERQEKLVTIPVKVFKQTK